MLYSYCIGCWSILASSLEHWRPAYNNSQYRMYCLVTLNPYLWRGIIYDLYFLDSSFHLAKYTSPVGYSLNFDVSFEQQKRVALLMASGAFQGASIGPLIELAIETNPRYVPAHQLYFGFRWLHPLDDCQFWKLDIYCTIGDWNYICFVFRILSCQISRMMIWFYFLLIMHHLMLPFTFITLLNIFTQFVILSLPLQAFVMNTL